MKPGTMEPTHETVRELTENYRLSDTLRYCLDDLEHQINPAVEEQLMADYRTFLDGNWPEPLFTPQRPAPAPAGIGWPAVHINETLDDFSSMALQQFGACSNILASGSGAPLAVRANYGVGISSAWFGCPIRVMDTELDLLPTSLPLADTSSLDVYMATGVPEVTTGFGARVFAMGQIFRLIMREYPNIHSHVHVYHPDFQSPIDTCELVWGSEVMVAFYEQPERVHRFLDLITETYIDAIRRWSAIHPFSPDMNAHWNLMHKGNIVLRTDSGMNLSPSMYDEFIKPYEQRCLDACGGGPIHFCGRGDHFIASMSELRGLTGINMSQPHLNDMEVVYQHTVDKGIPLLGLGRSAAETALEAGRDLHHRVSTTPY